MNKVAAHIGILENKKADKLAKESTTLDTIKWAYNAKEITGFEDAKRAATFVTHEIKANFSITVNRTLSSTKTEAKAVLLALKTVSYKCKLTLNTDS
ncbi:hypothetical protein G9A89_011197 [Geosiphon pyriformis]|nr:hypothetical protein G9A89_011197 [Geosiphon pyriformis]